MSQANTVLLKIFLTTFKPLIKKIKINSFDIEIETTVREVIKMDKPGLIKEIRQILGQDILIE